MSEITATGHCYCGAVTFEVSGSPIWVSHCHCESCRRHCSSVVATFVGYSPEQVSFTASQPASYSSEDGVKRSFCGKCGSPVSYESNRWRDQLHLYLGIFDEPNNIRPQDHVFCEEKIGWLNIEDDLPRCQGSSGETN